MESENLDISAQIESLKVLIVDDEHNMRKVTRGLLLAIGARNIHEANDGMTGLEAICVLGPDLVILDWEMPGMNGPDFVRHVRSPGTFPLPNVPIIMLTAYGERSRVVEAVRLGANDYLLKPVSTKALRARIVSILTNPRRIVKKGDYYGPEPRKLSSYKPENDPHYSNVVFVS
jgi:two-component system, chemotaxis family, chemotaxis protein CheY